MVKALYGSYKLLDGNEIPSPAFGTGTALYNKDAEEQVLTALKAGFRHIDAAQVYGNEESVGQAIKESGISREQLYVTTKYGGGDVKESFEASLRKLGLSYVDLYLIHQPKFAKEGGGLDKVWNQLEDFKEQGCAKSIGVSNFKVPDLEELLA